MRGRAPVLPSCKLTRVSHQSEHTCFSLRQKVSQSHLLSTMMGHKPRENSRTGAALGNSGLSCSLTPYSTGSVRILTFLQPTLIFAASAFGNGGGIKASHTATSCAGQRHGSAGALGLETLLPRAVHRRRRVHGALHTLARDLQECDLSVEAGLLQLSCALTSISSLSGHTRLLVCLNFLPPVKLDHVSGSPVQRCMSN